MEKKSINTVVADSQFLVVEGLKSIINNDERFTFLSVHTHCELLSVLEHNGGGLLITDIALFDNNIEELERIKLRFINYSILVLTSSISKSDFAKLSKIGIKNIIYKTADGEEIIAAIEATIKGKKYYTEEVLDMMLELGETRALPVEPTNLTNTELEIVRLIARGLTTKEIANQKYISFHTVNTHRKNIFRKMGVCNASELIMQAIKAGWIDNIEYFI